MFENMFLLVYALIIATVCVLIYRATYKHRMGTTGANIIKVIPPKTPMGKIKVSFAGQTKIGRLVDSIGKKVWVAIEINGHQHLVRRKVHQMEWVQ